MVKDNVKGIQIIRWKISSGLFRRIDYSLKKKFFLKLTRTHVREHNFFN